MDLVHVDDIARMLADALNFGDDELFDAGTGQPITVNEVAEIVNSAAGSEAGVEYLPMRKGEHRADDVLAEGVGWEVLGWRPKFEPAQLVETVQTYRDAPWYGLSGRDVLADRSSS